MFNEMELEFIGESVDRDLKTVRIKINNMVDEMAVLGKRISDLKVLQSKLESVATAIADGKTQDNE